MDRLRDLGAGGGFSAVEAAVRVTLERTAPDGPLHRGHRPVGGVERVVEAQDVRIRSLFLFFSIIKPPRDDPEALLPRYYLYTQKLII